VRRGAMMRTNPLLLYYSLKPRVERHTKSMSLECGPTLSNTPHIPNLKCRGALVTNQLFYGVSCLLIVHYFIFFITLKPRVEWHKTL